MKKMMHLQYLFASLPNRVGRFRVLVAQFSTTHPAGGALLGVWGPARFTS